MCGKKPKQTQQTSARNKQLKMRPSVYLRTVMSSQPSATAQFYDSCFILKVPSFFQDKRGFQQISLVKKKKKNSSQ